MVPKVKKLPLTIHISDITILVVSKQLDLSRRESNICISLYQQPKQCEVHSVTKIAYQFFQNLVLVLGTHFESSNFLPFNYKSFLGSTIFLTNCLLDTTRDGPRGAGRAHSPPYILSFSKKLALAPLLFMALLIWFDS